MLIDILGISLAIYESSEYIIGKIIYNLSSLSMFIRDALNTVALYIGLCDIFLAVYTEFNTTDSAPPYLHIFRFA